MSDPRLTPDRSVARFERPARIKAPFVDLNRHPDGPRDRQVILGDPVLHLGTTGSWAYVKNMKDGYLGYLPARALNAAPEPTHWVVAPSTHSYQDPDIKSPDLCALTFGSQVTVSQTSRTFAATNIGYVPLQHLQPLSDRFDDPAAVAMLFLGSPYLWGGNTRWGIDCSGLIQAALLACGLPCPGDSDMQMALGTAAKPPYQRNDLLFWKGHVALVTDPNTLIHANAHAMAVRYEPISDTIARIKTAGDGPVTAHRRL